MTEKVLPTGIVEQLRQLGITHADSEMRRKNENKRKSVHDRRASQKVRNGVGKERVFEGSFGGYGVGLFPRRSNTRPRMGDVSTEERSAAPPHAERRKERSDFGCLLGVDRARAGVFPGIDVRLIASYPGGDRVLGQFRDAEQCAEFVSAQTDLLSSIATILSIEGLPDGQGELILLGLDSKG